MLLKNIVDEILKERGRSLSWLAEEMNKTFDGLKLGLIKGSIKYNDIIVMAKTLNVSPSVFFEHTYTAPNSSLQDNILNDGKTEYNDLKKNLKNCKEMLSTLKDQLKDKEKIISLLSNQH